MFPANTWTTATRPTGKMMGSHWRFTEIQFFFFLSSYAYTAQQFLLDRCFWLV